MIGRRIERDRKGGYRLRLPREERELLASLPRQLREVLNAEEPDPALRRLFPPPMPTIPGPTTSTGG